MSGATLSFSFLQMQTLRGNRDVSIPLKWTTWIGFWTADFGLAQTWPLYTFGKWCELSLKNEVKWNEMQ